MEESLRKCPLCRHNGFMSDDICEDCENQSKFEIMPEVEEALKAERMKGCLTADAVREIAAMQARIDELERGVMGLALFAKDETQYSIRSDNHFIQIAFKEVGSLHCRMNALTLIIVIWDKNEGLQTF